MPAEDEEEADDDNDSDAESELSNGSSDAKWDSDFELPADKLSMRLRSIHKRTTTASAKLLMRQQHLAHQMRMANQQRILTVQRQTRSRAAQLVERSLSNS